MSNSRLLAIAAPLAAAALAAAAPARAQLDLPRVSPQATISQTVGLTNVTITYCRPGVKGRAIWGGLVPYDQVWRTGANEATTITFADDVTIDGTKLPAGTYGLFTIPGKDEWTIIFNKGAKQWGAYQYKQAEDVLRIKVKPHEAPFRELLTFCFPAVATDSATVAIVWDKLAVPFTFTVDTVDKVLAQARKAIAEAKPDDWRTSYRAAAFCLDNNVNLPEARTWLAKSVAVKETMYNLAGQARFLALDGKKAEAIALAKKAIAVGKAADPKADTGMVDNLIKEW
ncbi:MAG: DUF2911 domain-containing protein, partial [Thermoanaerobaculaceae bacterium]|nr:DUF2911 domain-containing protein [Thermoanaerobaculaceae bacterium]